MIKEFFYKILLRITDYDYFDEYSSICNNQKQFENYQKELLQKLILHCYENVTYYKNLFEDIGLIKNKQIELEKFTQIPILTKEKLRENFNQLKSNNADERKSFDNSTGGSTGEPVKFMHDREYEKWCNAANRFYFKNILEIDDLHSKKVVLWGSDKDLFKGTIGYKAKILNYLTNTVLLNSFKMTDQNMEKYVRIINSYKPKILRGYAGSLYELSLFIKRTKSETFSPLVIISEAENLTDEMKKTIEGAFDAKVYNNYGSREIGPTAGECKKGNFHVFDFHNFIEIVDKEGKPSSDGRIVVTNLHNYSMPFIRYEIGDTGILNNKKCSCHLKLPIIEKLTGRIVSTFLLKNGTTVPSEFFIHLIGVVSKDLPIKKFQVIQESFEKIKIMVVLKKTLPTVAKHKTEQQIRQVMGKNCQIEWQIVNDIPKTSSGKYIYTKSLINK